jgi:hypothetical protein
VLQGLDLHSKAALALIYMRNEGLNSPVTLQPSEKEALERLGSDLGSCVTALEALNGSLVQRIDADGDFVWKFKHPTIGDAYAALLVQSPELLGIHLHGAAIEELTGQVTCGDVGIERAVVIPRALFPLMLQRLKEFTATPKYKTVWMSPWGARRDLQRFLAFRCSKDFLSLHIEQNPEISAYATNGEDLWLGRSAIGTPSCWPQSHPNAHRSLCVAPARTAGTPGENRCGVRRADGETIQIWRTSAPRARRRPPREGPLLSPEISVNDNWHSLTFQRSA